MAPLPPLAPSGFSASSAAARVGPFNPSPAPARRAPSDGTGVATVPAEGAGLHTEPGSSYLSRMRADVFSRPGRLLAALLATVLAPALIPDTGVSARATAVIGGRSPGGPARSLASPGRAPVANASPDPALASSGVRSGPVPLPVTGDLISWRTAAKAAAATCPGLPAEVLVAIGLVETGLGLGTDPSHAGAVGPMQFLPATWAVYGADGDGDGRADVYNPLDALHGAARLLCANGGSDPHRLRSAVWNYNHSTPYVERVVELAGLATAGFGD